jgi:hypothetical protein
MRMPTVPVVTSKTVWFSDQQREETTCVALPFLTGKGNVFGRSVSIARVLYVIEPGFQRKTLSAM